MYKRQVSCVLLVPALLLLTVSSGIICFVSPIVLFIDSISGVLLAPALLLLTVSSGKVCFVSPIVLFIDSIVRFVSSGAAFADSFERNRTFCVSDRSFY